MSREQFETFLIGEYEWAQGALNAAIFCGDDATGHYVCGEHIYDRQDCSECLFWAWRGWQAASKASEQQLAAVVVENAGLKKFCKNAAFDADYEAELCMERGGFTGDLNDIKTPATDAAIANIQAQGVDIARNAMIDFVDGEIGPNENVPGLIRAAEICVSIAAQLRQGAEHE